MLRHQRGELLEQLPGLPHRHVTGEEGIRGQILRRAAGAAVSQPRRHPFSSVLERHRDLVFFRSRGGTLLEEEVLHTRHAGEFDRRRVVSRRHRDDRSRVHADQPAGAALVAIADGCRERRACALAQVTDGPREVRRRVGDHHQLVGHRIRAGRLAGVGEEPVERARERRSLAGLHARHHHRHLVARSRGGDGEHDFVAEQRAHRLHAIDDPSQLQLPRQSSTRRETRRSRMPAARPRPGPRRSFRRDWARRRRRTPQPEDTRAGPKRCATDSRTAQSGVRSWRTTPGAAGTASASGLQAMAWATDVASAGLDAACWPGLSRTSRPG